MRRGYSYLPRLVPSLLSWFFDSLVFANNYSISYTIYLSSIYLYIIVGGVIEIKQYYKINRDGLIIQCDSESYDWVEVITPSKDELDSLSEASGIDSDSLKLTLDSQDSNRIEGLTNDDSPLRIILQYPEKVDSILGAFNEYDTFPLVICLTNENKLITVSNGEPSFMRDIIINSDNVNEATNNKKDIVLLAIYYLSKQYNTILTELKQESIELKRSLRSSMDNDVRYHIMSIQSTLASFDTSLEKNYDICKQLVEDESYFESKEYTKLARKASIELDESKSLLQYLKTSLDHYESLIDGILNSNTTSNMRTFTILNIIASFVTLLTGYFGVNFAIPGQNYKYAFYLFTSALVLIGILLYRWLNHHLEG